jgi:hypothetical protein
MDIYAVDSLLAGFDDQAGTAFARRSIWAAIAIPGLAFCGAPNGCSALAHGSR